MSESHFRFLEIWQTSMFYLAPSMGGIGILIYLLFRIKFSSQKSFKDKYDFVSQYEFGYYLATHICIALGIFFIFNTYNAQAIAKSMFWFYVRLAIGFCLAVLYGYVAQLMLKFWYPSIQTKKLKRLRYTPRINPKTGNEMKLLSEEEEDAYLDEGMQAEEDVFSVDYDVWIDVETNDTHIEKYEGRLHALECDRCGFQTLKLEKEEIIKEAKDHDDGELLKHYKCSYCKRIKRKTVRLSQTKTESDFEVNEHTKFVEDPLHIGSKVVLVKMEIHSSEGDVKNFEFQNAHEAEKFLKEFDFDKVVNEQ